MNTALMSRSVPIMTMQISVFAPSAHGRGALHSPAGGAPPFLLGSRRRGGRHRRRCRAGGTPLACCTACA
eukprot:6302848-Prymnesium_polylepis.1